MPVPVHLRALERLGSITAPSERELFSVDTLLVLSSQGLGPGLGPPLLIPETAPGPVVPKGPLNLPGRSERDM